VINPEFIGYLRLTVSPEAGEILSNAYNVLTQTGSVQHEFAITQFLGMADNDETATSIVYIENCLSESLADKLGEHGVVFSERALPLMTAVLEACSSIDSYGDPETIYNICGSDGTPEEKLSEIMELFSPYKWSDFLPVIESVTPDLITAISGLLRERAERAIMLEEDFRPTELVVPIEEIRRRTYAYTASKPYLQIRTLIREGTPLGLDIELYTQLCKEYLTNLPPATLVPELIGIALASNLLKDDLKAAIKEQIETFHGNINVVTQANIVLSKEAYHE
jgi:hypothetical protein